jgi:hypothetical protein
MTKRDDGTITIHHLTALHLRDALAHLPSDGGGQQPLEQKHLTSAHLQEALQHGNLTPPASSQQQQTGSVPVGTGSGQSDKK